MRVGMAEALHDARSTRPSRVRVAAAWPALAAAIGLAAGCAGGQEKLGRDSGPSPDADVRPGGDASLEAGTAFAGTLVVGTWNVEQFPEASSTVRDVAAAIEDMGLDVVAMQEVADTAGFDALVAALPGWDGVVAAQGDGWIRNALLWRTSKVTARDFELLFPTDPSAFPRPPLKARLVAGDGAGGVFDFVIVVVHLKALGDVESRGRRRVAVEALHSWVAAQVAAGPEDDFIVLGDWNDELTDAPAENVFMPFLNEPRAFTFLTLPLEQAGGSCYVPFDSFIAHVLLTNGALDEYGATGDTRVEPLDDVLPRYESTISDHRPVVATFRGSP